MTRFSTVLVFALSACVRGPKAETVEVTELSEIDYSLDVYSAQDRNGVQSGGIGLYLWLWEFDSEEVCPEMPDAVVTIGSATARVVTDGGYYIDHSAYAPLTPQRVCDDIFIEWAGDWSDVAGAAEVVLTDDSGSVSLPTEGAFSAREFAIVTPTDSVITAGGEVSLSYSPADDEFEDVSVYLASSTVEDLEVEDLTATAADGLIDVDLPATLAPALDVLGAYVDYEYQEMDDGRGLTGGFNRVSVTEFSVTVQ